MAIVSDTDDNPAVSKPVELAADYQAEQYVASMYDGHWWVGSIIEQL